MRGCRMTYEEKSAIVIEQLRADRDRLLDVLDKIRAEIELHRRKTESIDPYDLVGDCLDIIDKYKAENDDSLLTSDERAYALTLITKTLQANSVNLEVAGYEDCDGVCFNLMLGKADENKPAVEFQHADSSNLPEGWEATT